MHAMPAGRQRQRLISALQPLLHHGDLIFLRQRNSLRDGGHGITLGAFSDQCTHLDRLGVVGNHALHEFHVRIGKAQAHQVGRFST